MAFQCRKLKNFEPLQCPDCKMQFEEGKTDLFIVGIKEDGSWTGGALCIGCREILTKMLKPRDGLALTIESG
jgi:hypothetical protein